jgi:type I restriction-modification system DNA methylase subunit
VTSAPRREVDVLGRIRDILSKFVGQKFNEVTIAGVREQYEVDGRFADLAILKDDGKPILLIETKKVRHHARGFSVERRFIVTSEDVVGQVVAYAAILKKSGIYVPFVATANDKQLALFKVPENIDELVDWKAIKDRRYDRVIKNFYEFRGQNLISHERHNFSEEFFMKLLDTVTGIYKKKYGIEEKRQELHWIVIEDLRGFVDFLSPFIEEAIAPNGRFRPDLRQRLDEYSRRTGYRPTPDGLAREMAYVLMNKIVFYKVLERFYNLPRLEPLRKKGVVTSCSSYIKKLNEYFEKAVEVSKDFEAIFRTGVYDVTENDVVENRGVLDALDWLIEYLGQYKIEELGDIVGYIYEELIPPEVRHVLGQFYTPKPIAELIVKWAVRSPDDKVLDPGCGSGTFLVEAYKRLAELKLKRSFKEIKHVPKDVHEQILSQLYGIDINEFPAHLTAMNLAMKNVRVPSPALNIFVRDYFTILPGHKTFAPYKVETPEGEKKVEVTFKDFDAVVGNPPYTRWDDIEDTTRRYIINSIGDLLKKYDLLPQIGRRGAEYTMVVFWIAHSIGFLKEGGRLGMIVSDSWLQTVYGVRFGRLLADRFKIHAVIDISARVFPTPLIGSCIILLEKSSNEHERYNNDVAFVYLNVKKGGIDVHQLLKLVEEKKPLSLSTNDYDIIIKIHKQSEVKESNKPWIQFLFNVDYVITQLKESKIVTQLDNYFEPAYGNILYTVLYTRRIVKTKHAGVGGDKFFYLSEEDVEKYGIPQEFLYPVVANARNLSYFTFTKEDWENLRKGKARCYLFLCHKPRNELPSQVLRYIHLGETEIKPSKGVHKEEPVSKTEASENRRKLKQFFFDWYDLGGVISVPIASPRYARYWHRFNVIAYDVAFSDDFMTFIPRQGVVFNEKEVKALLAYLNSSITKLYLEAYGRTAGGVAALGLEARLLSNLPVLDVKKLPREDVERLAQLFDRLESEARRLGGADEAENVFGSELAKELTGRVDVRVGIQGLFNTVIKEIDYEIARILGLEHLVEAVRAMVLELVRRRLSRAREPRREAIRGSEEHRELQRPRRRRGPEGGGGFTRRLDEFF